MPDSLSPVKRIELLHILKKLPRAVLEEIRIGLGVPVDILSISSPGERAVSIWDWAESSIGCGLMTLKDVTDAIVAEYKGQDNSQELLTLIEADPSDTVTDTLDESLLAQVFEQFITDDFADLQRAFFRAFKSVKGATFRKVRPDHPSLKFPDCIKGLLLLFGDMVLVVRFIEFALVELERTYDGQNRDLGGLEKWRDRLSNDHNIALLPDPKPIKQEPQAYLLVSVQEMGLVTDGVESVNVFTELYVTGAANPIEFEENGTVNCPIDKVDTHVSKWIKAAESEILAYGCSQVTVEVFLSRAHLEMDVGKKWTVMSTLNDPLPLGKYRAYLIRSLERALNEKLQFAIKQRWTVLENYVEAGAAYKQFHPQKERPECGDLCSLKAPGLKLVAQLPDSDKERYAILGDVVESGVPIALWSAKGCKANKSQRMKVFDGLLQDSCVTDFAVLAYQWQQKRNAKGKIARSLRLLCDRPDRWPTIPSNGDALVAL